MSTRKTPDGNRDVIEMQVPIRSSTSRTVLLSGLGVPMKIGVGAVDLEDEVWLELQNRFKNPYAIYDTVETVHFGLVRLNDTPLKGDDQTFAARGGATFKTGALKERSGAGKIVYADVSPVQSPMAAWTVNDQAGKYLIVLHAELDSFQVADLIAPHMVGEFCVEMITAGTMTAASEITVPGWNVCLRPAYVPKLAMN